MKRAFTLVELLVVITILGLLLGLLFPAVHAARRASRAAECQNNLHQMAVDLAAREGPRELLPHAFDSPASRQMRCPELDQYGNNGTYNQFIYYERRPVIVATYDTPSSHIVTVCDLSPIHDGARQAAYLDGHVGVIGSGDVGYEEYLTD